MATPRVIETVDVVKGSGARVVAKRIPLERTSAFPFKLLEELVARIDGKRVVIEKA